MTFADHFSSRPTAYARFRPHYPARLFEVLAELPRRRQESQHWSTKTWRMPAEAPVSLTITRR